ncbi:hypothetical protein, partial [Streptomyces sp. VRA16 Mangrove soil]|uniref:hypothetical protein n=1 Tax=Streptomyces sp. VRA16 Mangrove soil TaxID=2817434 RepID=UPI001A9DABB1
LFQRNLILDLMAGDGVSTYLALIFGTLLSSQGTDASFVLTLSGFPPGASLRSFFLAFPTLSDRFTGRFPRGLAPLSGLSAFRRFRLYQILSGLIPSQRGLSFRLLGRSDE